MRIPKGLLLVSGIAIPAACVLLTVPWHSPDAPVVSPVEASYDPEKSDLPSNNSQTLTKIYGSAENDLRTVVYRLRGDGNPRTCDIFDAKGTRLLKVRFGYNVGSGATRGKLAEVWIHDARETPAAPGMNPKPLRRILQPYDSDGERMEPRVFDDVRSDTLHAALGPALLGFNPITDLAALRSPAGTIPNPNVAR